MGKGGCGVSAGQTHHRTPRSDPGGGGSRGAGGRWQGHNSPARPDPATPIAPHHPAGHSSPKPSWHSRFWGHLGPKFTVVPPTTGAGHQGTGLRCGGWTRRQDHHPLGAMQRFTVDGLRTMDPAVRDQLGCVKVDGQTRATLVAFAPTVGARVCGGRTCTTLLFGGWVRTRCSDCRSPRTTSQGGGVLETSRRAQSEIRDGTTARVEQIQGIEEDLGPGDRHLCRRLPDVPKHHHRQPSVLVAPPAAVDWVAEAANPGAGGRAESPRCTPRHLDGGGGWRWGAGCEHRSRHRGADRAPDVQAEPDLHEQGRQLRRRKGDPKPHRGARDDRRGQDPPHPASDHAVGGSEGLGLRLGCGDDAEGYLAQQPPVQGAARGEAGDLHR
eukprot:m.226912 g.226912  ORF g.226912 m.226912 type:complete len:383 (-) comp25935_c1_seq12:5307-6455(-)